MRYRVKRKLDDGSVSIHAPARGAMTPSFLLKYAASFNSRTREGCDSQHFVITSSKVFQFTHPRGVRSNWESLIGAKIVSIHAPARGAMATAQAIRMESCFNSRTREGCDLFRSIFWSRTLFQFTHPRGVRCSSGSAPRPSLVSIHAPARGAIIGVRNSGGWQSFNSRTREGCDGTI